MMRESIGKAVWLNKRNNCLKVKGVVCKMAHPTGLGLAGFLTAVEGFKLGNSMTRLFYHQNPLAVS